MDFLLCHLADVTPLGREIFLTTLKFSHYTLKAKGIFWDLIFRILYLLEMIFNNLLMLSLFHLDNMKSPISINLEPCIELKGTRGHLHMLFVPSKSKVLFLYINYKGSRNVNDK